MNTRDYKLFRAGNCYHIYNRGDNKEEIFKEPQDYENFLKRLKLAAGIPIQTTLRIKPCPKDSFYILSYCLMPNHYHILVKQNSEVPIGDLINKVATSYVKYFNAKYRRVGNLFQDIFKAKHIDSDSYLTYVTAYIHNNPADPFRYTYSSLPDYLGLRAGTLCNTEFILNLFKKDRAAYKKFVECYTFQD